MHYIKEHPVAVLSTTDQNQMVYGAAVYICATSANQLYFVTKTQTQKFQNIQSNPQAAITIVDPNTTSSLQANGQTKTIKDASLIELIMAKMAKIYAHAPDWLPPITKIRAGAYQVVEIQVQEARLAHYQGFRPGDSRIFSQIQS